MITEIISLVLALCYYLFSVSFTVAYMEPEIHTMKWYLRITAPIAILVVAPVFVPIGLGIEFGIKLSD